jgi:hypothetical protein
VSRSSHFCLAHTRVCAHAHTDTHTQNQRAAGFQGAAALFPDHRDPDRPRGQEGHREQREQEVCGELSLCVL